jgi:TonB family protein
LADHRVLQQGIEQGAYFDLLLRQLVLSNISVGAKYFLPIPGHHFNYLLTKNRFKMLKNHHYSKWAFAKVIFVLPFIALLLRLNCKNQTEEPKVIEYNLTLENMDLKPDEEITYEVEITEGEAKGQKVNLKITPKENNCPDGELLEYLEGKDLDIKFLDDNGNVMEGYTFVWNEDAPCRDVEEMPEFMGGMNAMGAFLSGTIKYPENARAQGIKGQVMVEFVVKKDGSIGDVKVIKSVDPELDAEAVRVVSMMPKWKPGKQNGKLVHCYYNIPIRFTVN